jgi:polar amino acid transport system permease protein
VTTATDPSAPGSQAPEGEPRGAAVKAIPARHPARRVATTLVVLLLVVFLLAISTSKNFQWNLVRQYFTTSAVLHGLLVTLELTVLAMAIGVAGGVILAVMRLSPVPVISGTSWVYIWFFRGTPVLVQLYLWFYIAALTGQHPAIGIPLTHFSHFVFHVNINPLITTFTAAVFGLGFNEAAYMAEIVRAGILSVDEGQTEAAQSVGMTRLQTMRLIVLPQAMRVIIPPTGNETISMLKTSSLASTIGLLELFGATQAISARTFQPIPLLIVASLWYLIVTSVLTVGQFYVERHFARGHTRNVPETPLQRLRAIFTRNATSFHGGMPPLPPTVPGAEHR